MDWMPIDSAPLDGTWVLLWCGYGIPDLGFFGQLGQWEDSSNFIEPTHWMPLPEPPK